MADRISTSKKRSGASYSERRDSPLVVFLDRSLGNTLLAERLRSIPNVKVELHSSYFAPDAPDTEWIPRVAKEGWIILTKDKAITHRKLEIEAVVRNEAYLITFGTVNSTAEQMEFSFEKAHNKIRRETAERCAPFFGRITKGGEFNVL